MIIRNATMEDVGEYSCFVENVKCSTEVELEGEEQKLVIFRDQIQATIVAQRGQDVNCSIPFEPCLMKPEVQWSFNGSEIQGCEKVELSVTRDQASMSLKQIRLVDAGTYRE